MNNHTDIMNSNTTLTQTRRTREKGIRQPISLLTIDDIYDVLSLSNRYFPRSAENSLYIQKQRMVSLYFKDGVLLPHASPLVSRSPNGWINGFLGIITKKFRYKDRTIQVAHCHHLVANKDGRKRLMPLRLLQKFFAGPQDIFFSDGSSDTTKQLWKRLGGETVMGESIYYKVPLRPASFTADHFLKKYDNRIGDSLRSVAAFTDSVAGKMHTPLFHRNKPEINFVPLSTRIMRLMLEKMKPHYLLFPDYDSSDIERLFQLLDGETRYGTLHKVALFGPNDQPLGWFIYYAQKKGVCEVIQAVSLPGKETKLFDALAWHAFSMGGVELSGRLMPSQLQTPFTTKAIDLPARMWTLIKSDDIELKHLIHTGKAFMTRLEGDLWVL